MRPFDSSGMDRAMSDQRVNKLTLTVNRQNGIRKRDYITVTVWDRAFPHKPAPDYKGLGINGIGHMLTVHMGDARALPMYRYLMDEAANAVRKPKKRAAA